MQEDKVEQKSLFHILINALLIIVIGSMGMSIVEIGRAHV